MFLRTREIPWEQLKYHVSHQKDFNAGETHFFWFCPKVTWMKLKFKSSFVRFLTDLATSKWPGEVKNDSKMFGKCALES